MKRAREKKSDSSGEMWIEKYRPRNMEEVVYHSHIIKSLKVFLSKGQMPHLLFYGPPGTGKTSTIKAFSTHMKHLNNSQTLELNASDSRGIKVVRDQITTFASTRALTATKGTGFKLIILDEADALTTSAQMALRRIIEQFAQNARFCLICNYADKIIPALQSRCTRFRFQPLPQADVVKRLDMIAKEEKLKYTPKGLNAINSVAEGDMRKCVNILQATALSFRNNITPENVYECTGSPEAKFLSDLLNKLLIDDYEHCYKFIVDAQKERGYALSDILTGVQKLIKDQQLHDITLMYLYSELADAEERLATCLNETRQLPGFIGIFSSAAMLNKTVDKA